MERGGGGGRMEEGRDQVGTGGFMVRSAQISATQIIRPFHPLNRGGPFIHWSGLDVTFLLECHSRQQPQWWSWSAVKKQDLALGVDLKWKCHNRAMCVRVCVWFCCFSRTIKTLCIVLNDSRWNIMVQFNLQLPMKHLDTGFIWQYDT